MPRFRWREDGKGHTDQRDRPRPPSARFLHLRLPLEPEHPLRWLSVAISTFSQNERLCQPALRRHLVASTVPSQRLSAYSPRSAGDRKSTRLNSSHVSESRL